MSEETELKWMRRIGTLQVMDYTENAYNTNKENLEILPNDFDVVALAEHVKGLQIKTVRNTEYCDRYFKRYFEKRGGEKSIKIGESDANLEKLKGLSGTFVNDNKVKIVIEGGIIVDVEMSIGEEPVIEVTAAKTAKAEIDLMEKSKVNI